MHENAIALSPSRKLLEIEPEPPRAVMHRKCMDCGADLGDMAVAPDDPCAGRTSHGLCERCYALRVAGLAAPGSN
jgi:hypothetical protein